jgi:hypothetical protein
LIPLWSLSAFFLYGETLRAAKTSKSEAQSVRYRTQPAWKQPSVATVNETPDRETPHWLALRTRSVASTDRSTNQNKLADTGSTTLEALRTASTTGAADQKSVTPNFTWDVTGLRSISVSARI